MNATGQNTTCQSNRVVAIVKPTLECNLNCAYCYEGHNANCKKRMNVTTAKNVVTKFARYNGSEHPTELIWHGGEPLLMGVGFYEQVFAVQKTLEPDYHFNNKIQVNGTLLDSEFLELFDEHNVRVGVSLDGPQSIHDTHRPYPDGSGSFDDVMAGIHLLNDYYADDQGKTRPQAKWGKGALAVFTPHTMAHVDQFYRFFEEQQLNLKINPLFFEGRGREVQQKWGVTPKVMGEAMTGVFDEWFYQDEPTISVEPFVEILRNLITGQPHACIFKGTCHHTFLHVAPDGDVYLCGLWPSEGMSLGNINTHDVAEMLASPRLEQVEHERQMTKEQCAQCEFFVICNSGCLRRAFARRGSFSDKDYHCPYYQQLFSHLQHALSQELKTSIWPIHDINSEALHNNTLKAVVETRFSPDDWCVHSDYDVYSTDYGDWGFMSIMYPNSLIGCDPLMGSHF